MKRKYLIVSLVVLVLLGVYLNRTYAYIYHKINQANLKSADQIGTYNFYYNEANKNLTYVALGDSLTAGVGTKLYEESYPYLLSQKLVGDKKANIILKDLAIPGAKTEDVINNFLSQTIASQPEIITLLIGVNDLHGGVAADDFQKNYEQILTELTQKTKAKIYLINLPKVGANNLFLFPYNYYFPLKTESFNKIIKAEASKFNLTYIDLEASTTGFSKENNAYYAADFFHPSAVGYGLWANIIYAGFDS